MQQLNIIVAGRFQLVAYLADGGQGEVYEAIDLRTNQQVALKIAPSDKAADLAIENDFYDKLQRRRGTGMLSALFFSDGLDDYAVLALPLLGPNLYDLFQYCDGSFSLKTVLLIADQVLLRLRFLHSQNIIHRDIKPGNLIMGRGIDGNTIYLADYGLAGEKVQAPGNPLHYGNHREKSVVGTIEYASNGAHMFQCQTYRDDLESFGYLMVEFLTGGLPWNGVRSSPDRSRAEKIGEIKETITLDELCEDVPNVFKEYFKHLQKLRYNERPDYAWLRKLFSSEFKRRGYKYDHVYDWTEERFREVNADAANAAGAA
ncbi:double-time [Aspergillus sclerotiicarbonarius CBS 121057]|uniref:non-specific serine/threonine protein kinase n=1 Tax=Aspergillus sclerotiicarbonarius (strain CBS 121057 / IBT 28362) TaxID=1448318 RepID=A0A319EUR9_ASPSB|nr:double-time [Aspergillus sclerotiicarbonarius CBS 121057]